MIIAGGDIKISDIKTYIKIKTHQNYYFSLFYIYYIIIIIFGILFLLEKAFNLFSERLSLEEQGDIYFLIVYFKNYRKSRKK